MNQEQKIAGVLGEHRIEQDWDCTCGAVFYEAESLSAISTEAFESAHEAHQAAILAPLIAAPQAEALREAAGRILTNDPLDYWSQHLPEGLGFQEAMASWLRAHAAAMDPEGRALVHAIHERKAQG